MTTSVIVTSSIEMILKTGRGSKSLKIVLVICPCCKVKLVLKTEKKERNHEVLFKRGDTKQAPDKSLGCWSNFVHGGVSV